MIVESAMETANGMRLEHVFDGLGNNPVMHCIRIDPICRSGRGL